MKKIPFYSKFGYILTIAFGLFLMGAATWLYIEDRYTLFGLIAINFMGLIFIISTYNFKNKYILFDEENDKFVLSLDNMHTSKIIRKLSDIKVFEVNYSHSLATVTYKICYNDDTEENFSYYIRGQYVLQSQILDVASQVESYFQQKNGMAVKREEKQYSNDPKERLRQLKAESREIMKGKKK